MAPPADDGLSARRERPPVILLDALDQADFELLEAESVKLAELVASGQRLVPDFRELVRDLFAACVRVAVKRADPKSLPRSTALRQRLVDHVLASGSYAELHQRSRLRPDRAGLAALRLGEAILAELKAGRLMLQDELRESWQAEQIEQEIERLEAEAAAAELLAEAREGEVTERIAEAERDALAEEADVMRGELEALERDLQRAADQVPNESLDRVTRTLDRLPESLDAVSESEAQLGADADPRSEGASRGSGGQGEALDALELGERLTKNQLLQRLAKLVGALRADALAEQRKRVPKAKAEVFGVQMGRDVAHLLPSELMALRHPKLRLDFKRRLIEGRLMTYAVRGDDRQGRGPAVICLDLSGSMAGKKSIWAKAVAVTLADLARRDGRPVTVLTFSSGEGSLAAHEIVPDRRGLGRRAMSREALLSFVQTRVGGGTDFVWPLMTASELIRTSRKHKRGDVVLITDGEAHLDEAHLSEFEAFKRETDSRCLGVVVDVDHHRMDTLERLCDSVASVKALTVAGARQIFRAFR